MLRLNPSVTYRREFKFSPSSTGSDPNFGFPLRSSAKVLSALCGWRFFEKHLPQSKS
jgi:hypothetical protein